MKTDPPYPVAFPGLKQAGQHCADYLSRHVRKDGSFEYEIYARTGRTTTKYNILRHAGAIYAFSQWMNLHGPHGPGKIPDIMEKPTTFLLAHASRIESAGELYCIVEDDEVKLGGTALALLALVERYRLHPRKQDRIWMGRFAEFILWMQHPQGKFYSKFFYREQRFSDFESTYYPGEAILALLRLYRLDSDARWLQAAVVGSEYLLKHPVLDATGARGHNHWFVIALSELLEWVPREDFYTEFRLITEATKNAVRLHLAAAPSSASVATFGETAVAALLFECQQDRGARQDPRVTQDPHTTQSPRANVDELFALVKDILNYCLSLQVGGLQVGGPQQFQAGPPEFSESARGGIMESHTRDRIRIDFVQHTLQVISGLLLVQDH